MKKANFLMTAALVLAAGAAWAQPTLDGNIEPAEGWVEIAEESDGTFWETFQADKLFAYQDANYWYFAASRVNSDDWQMFGFAVDGNDATGASDDPWNRAFTYNQAQLPDVVFHGNWNNSYGELYVWNGTALEVVNEDPGSGATQNRKDFGDMAVNVGATEVEIRIAKSRYAGLSSPGGVGVTYYTSGNNDEHGLFDTIPDQPTVATSWNETGAPNALTAQASVPANASVADWMMIVD